jgi:hypothetical protein
LNNSYAIVPAVDVNPRHGQIIGNPLKLPIFPNSWEENAGKPILLAAFDLVELMQPEPTGR